MNKFHQMILKTFELTIQTYNFELEEYGKYFMVFSNEKVWFCVGHDARRSLTLYFCFQLIDSCDPSYDLGDVADLLNLSLNDFAVRGAVDEEDTVKLKAYLETLASDVQKYAYEFLSGSDVAFRKLKENREKRSDIYELQSKIDYMRRELDPTWRARDYKKVIKLLEPMKQHLLPSELKKLDYSKKHLKS